MENVFPYAVNYAIICFQMPNFSIPGITKEVSMQIDQTNSYSPPVDQLLTYGETRSQSPDEWPNYLELGIGPEHIPDLLRMVADEKLNEADIDNVQGWAP